MIQLKLLSPFVFAFAILMACTGAAGSNTNGSGGGDASFSAKIDGRVFSSTGTDQNTNAAFRLKGTEKHIFFKLADKDDPSERLNFEVPAQQGSTAIDPAIGYNGYIKGFVTYLDGAVTIHVTSITATRISGTFSGKYKAQKGSPANTPPVIQITDGKFDIPFSTSAQWKKFYQAE
ncbi:hypothetical protein [Puia sp.]|jgi:hypothetical protein|uniref:hypothetical protein n=1 Tax=Puia sp. TaxID=2045100 RepID=UPI002F3FA1F1